MAIPKPTVNSVIQRTPDVDLSQITATTEPVSTVAIEDWIDEALDELVALATSHGLDMGSSGLISQFQRAARAYASAQVIKRMGSNWEPLMSKYEAIYDRFDKKPSSLGASGSVVVGSGSRKSKSSWSDRDL